MPLNIIFITLLSIMVMAMTVSINRCMPPMIILDPAGDAYHHGRKIDDTFERGITLQCVEKIKTILENNHSITVSVTRFPGDIVYTLHNATHANHLCGDLFVSVNFYYTQDARPTVTIYTFSYGDISISHFSTYAFYPYDTAYLRQQEKTITMAHTLAHNLSKSEYNHLFSVDGPYALPLTQLIGMSGPSILIDAGVKDKTGWQYYVEPLAQEIVTIIEQMAQKIYQ